MHFGHTLRILRNTAGVSLRALARQIGVSPAYLSQVETGKVPAPRQARILEIEAALGVQRGYLLSAARRLDSQVVDFLQAVPAAADFLHAAMQARLKGAHFQIMTEQLARGGAAALHIMLDAAAPRRPDAVLDEPDAVRHLSDYLVEDRVLCLDRRLDKVELFDELARRVAPHLGGVDAATVVTELWAREREASTGIGSGIAVPHAELPGLAGAVALLAVLQPPVEYGAIDGEPVELCFLVLVPTGGGREHLELIARVAQLCSHPYFTAGLRNARDPAAILSFIQQHSPRIP